VVRSRNKSNFSHFIYFIITDACVKTKKNTRNESNLETPALDPFQCFAAFKKKKVALKSTKDQKRNEKRFENEKIKQKQKKSAEKLSLPSLFQPLNSFRCCLLARSARECSVMV